MILVGFVVMIALCCLTVIAAGGYLAILFDPVNLMIAVIPPFVVTATCGLHRGILIGLKILFGNPGGLSREEHKLAINAYGLLYKTSMGSGFIGTIIGTILTLMVLNDLTRIGLMLSIALYSLLYGFLFAFFLYLPIKVKLMSYIEKKQ